ncbi:ATP-binding cassette domain-containing protein, partial [Bordetella pertussis]
LTVRENLMMGHYACVRRGGVMQLLAPRRETVAAMNQVMEEITALFPRLAERMHQQAGTLSGGEGQMLAIGRALMSRPQLLMLDEPSFGLAPQIAREILESLPRLTERFYRVDRAARARPAAPAWAWPSPSTSPCATTPTC